MSLEGNVWSQSTLQLTSIESGVYTFTITGYEGDLVDEEDTVTISGTTITIQTTRGSESDAESVNIRLEKEEFVPSTERFGTSVNTYATEELEVPALLLKSTRHFEGTEADYDYANTVRMDCSNNIEIKANKTEQGTQEELVDVWQNEIENTGSTGTLTFPFYAETEDQHDLLENGNFMLLFDHPI